MKRRVFILGVFSSGTSLLSEVCKRLGYNMGQTQGPNYKNKFGNGEDTRTWQLAIDAFGQGDAQLGRAHQWAPGGLIEQTSVIDRLTELDENERPWGIKLPQLAFFPAAFLRPGWVDDSLLVLTIRNRADVLASLQKHHKTCKDPEATVDAYFNQLMRVSNKAHELGMPQLEMRFSFLIDRPTLAVPQLAEELGVREPFLINDAISAVDPEWPSFP